MSTSAVPAHAAGWSGVPRPGVSSRGEVSVSRGYVNLSGWVMDTRNDRKGVQVRVSVVDHYWCMLGGCFTRRTNKVVTNNRGYYRSVDFSARYRLSDGWDTIEVQECSVDRVMMVCAPPKVIWRR